MANPPGFWGYVLVNAGVATVSAGLLGLSVLAYRRDRRQRSYVIAAVGFGCILLSELPELVFSSFRAPDYAFTASEFLFLQAGEDLLLALGLGLLFFAITRHRPESSRADATAAPVDEEGRWPIGTRYDD